ncbi:MAG TPA: GNAT family N-acetyltransferase [Pyrinomonadaceae bacterium]|nr:GNAT family N-acetyltransferase [Pyrinomonadaceae bacterium]
MVEMTATIETAATTTAAAAEEKASIRVERYSSEHSAEWNEFVKNSKNGTFLFDRNYMDYHAERFTDCSLMFRDADDKLIAVMPANLKDDALISHGGLTFGGVVSNHRMKTTAMLEIFEGLIEFAGIAGASRIVYKAVPHIYHVQAAEEDLYALFLHDARLVKREVSTAINLQERLSVSKGRKWTINRSRKNKIEVRESDDFETFMRLETEVLAARYNVVPVHTAAVIRLLANRFPENIKLFAAFLNDEMLAGTIIYASQTLAHAQYIAATDEGKQLCALDAILQELIDAYYAEKRYFDFGISTERQGRYLNVGLVEYKESWGGRATVYDTYEIVF